MRTNKRFIALSAAVALCTMGAASAALATAGENAEGGTPAQNWSQIWGQNQRSAGTAFGYVVAPSDRASHERSRRHDHNQY
jgi:hypothetical protein